MVKGSVGVGMWSTCKVVHHVHAVGALVHQAAQARPLQARPGGGLGEGRRWSAARGPRPAGERRGAPAPGLVSASTTCTNTENSGMLGSMVTHNTLMAQIGHPMAVAIIFGGYVPPWTTYGPRW